MVAQALVRREADRDRFVAAVHRHQVDVEIEQQVGLGRAAREPYLFAMIGLAQHRELGAIFGVEVVQPLGPELLERALAHHAANLGLGHAPMERGRDDQMDVVDAVVGERLEHDVERAFADIGPAHLRQRQADVVDRDRDAHVGIELREQRIGVLGTQQRVADRGVRIGQRLQRRRRIDHSRAGGQLLVPEVVAIGDQPRRRAPVERHHQIAARAGLVPEFGGLQLFELTFRSRHP